jgi:hypothetical protein
VDALLLFTAREFFLLRGKSSATKAVSQRSPLDNVFISVNFFSMNNYVRKNNCYHSDLSE